MDDLNYLLHREQEELLHAQTGNSTEGRGRHRIAARGYAHRIRDHRHPYRSPVAIGKPSFDPYPYGAEGPRS